MVSGTGVIKFVCAMIPGMMNQPLHRADSRCVWMIFL